MSILPPGASVEGDDSYQRARLFFAWCFSKPTNNERAERLFRPHEIFRRCAARSWCDERLITSRKKLNPSSMPFPPHDLNREVFTDFEGFTEVEMSISRSAGSTNDGGPKKDPTAAG